MPRYLCLIAVAMLWRPALAQGQHAEEAAPTVEADLDGDGVRHRFTIVCSEAPDNTGLGEFRLEGQTAAGPCSLGPYRALAPHHVGQRLPDEVQALQVLPREPLAALDVNLDGRDELVARFRLPTSRTNVLTVIAGWNADKSRLVSLWEHVSDGVLSMDATGHGELVLLPYTLPAPKVPVFSAPFLWRDGQYRQSAGPLPDRLARAIAPIYARRIGSFELQGKVGMLREYVRATIAAGERRAASAAVERVLHELEQSEENTKAGRRAALILRGDVFVAWGVTSAALRAYREAFALAPEEGFDTPDGFAAYRLAVAKSSVGDFAGALASLDRAEEAEGQPGKFATARDALIPP